MKKQNTLCVVSMLLCVTGILTPGVYGAAAARSLRRSPVSVAAYPQLIPPAPLATTPTQVADAQTQCDLIDGVPPLTSVSPDTSVASLSAPEGSSASPVPPGHDSGPGAVRPLLDFTSGIREFEELVARVLNGGDPQEIIERIDSRKLDTAFGRVAAASAYNPERPGTSRLEELKEACLNHDNQRIEQFLEAARQAWRERGWM